MAMRCFFYVLVCVLAVAAITPSQSAAQSAEDLSALNQQISQLYEQGKYAEAIPIAERYVTAAGKRHGEEHVEYATAISWLGSLYKSQGRYTEAEPLYQRALAVYEKALGPEHPHVATSLNGLAALYEAQGRYAEAEPLYQRSLTITEKALGPDHADVGIRLNNLAALYEAQGRYAEAEPLYQRALAVYEKALGKDHQWVATSLMGLAELYHAQGRYADAEPLHQRALAVYEKALGKDHPRVGTSLSNLAGLYGSQGRYAEAEPLYQRALAIEEKALGQDHPSVATSLAGLAELYRAQGRYADAEPLYQRALAVYEKALGKDHHWVATSLNNLALLYHAQGRYGAAEPLYQRALTIRETALGKDHRDVGDSLNNLAGLYIAQGRYTEAEPLYQRSLAIRETALGQDHPRVGQSLNNLAGLYKAQGRYTEAEPLYPRSLAIWEKALGPDHPQVGASLNNLAALYRVQGRYAEAEPLYQRALAVYEKALGKDHPDVGTSLNSLAFLHFAQSKWDRAADFWRGSTDVLVRRAQRGTADVGQALTGKRKSEAEQASYQFWGLVKVGHRLALQEPGADPKLSDEMFRLAQWAHNSQTAAALSQMAARQAKGSGSLADLVRERQDLVDAWQTNDKARTAAASQPPDKRNAKAEEDNRRRLAEIEARIAEIDTTLEKDFSDYAAVARPEPLSVADVQAQLRNDEALVLFLDTPELKPTPEETFIWVVTQSDSRWVRSDVGTVTLKAVVQALRCGLDGEEWSGISAQAWCGKLLNVGMPGEDAPLPFNLEIAHALYQDLFGPIEDMIAGKRLLIVPSGPLTSLPFHVLVAQKPKDALPKTFEGYRNVAWLGRTQAISVLPSVSSLKALRAFAKGSASAKAYIGYGNPVLEGNETCAAIEPPKQCPKVEVASAQPQQVAALASGSARKSVRRRRGRRNSPNPAKVFATGGNKTVLANVRALCPLQDTAYEIDCVAKRLGVPLSEIRLDAAATEADIKALSASGALARYRVVHFATHGLLAGDVAEIAKRQGEPALVLTPPKEPKDADDEGLLTASEVSQLKLNANWVILSACNTAAGEELGAQALSGLARAFFYAGARALLVSHWPVYSDAAVRLTTRAIAEMEQDADLGRAAALQRSMIALMDDPTEIDNAHPAVWAPFVVVGEGGAAQK